MSAVERSVCVCVCVCISWRCLQCYWTTIWAWQIRPQLKLSTMTSCITVLTACPL